MLPQLGLETGIPVLNGILGCHTMEQVRRWEAVGRRRRKGPGVGEGKQVTVYWMHDLQPVQAEARATGDNNHGVYVLAAGAGGCLTCCRWWGKTAIEMATLRATQMGKVRREDEVCGGCRKDVEWEE